MSFLQTNRQQQIRISLRVLSEGHRQSKHRSKAMLREARRGAASDRKICNLLPGKPSKKTPTTSKACS
jgi:hypothetical protein